MGSFVDDLDGIGDKVSLKVTTVIISLLRSLVWMLNGNKDLISVLKILDSLKWTFRGKEVCCVKELNLNIIYRSIDRDLIQKGEVVES